MVWIMDTDADMNGQHTPTPIENRPTVSVREFINIVTHAL